MASVRDFKKDIKVMVENFIQECYVHLSYSPPTNVENVLDIISDALMLRDEMIGRISHVEPVGRRGKKEAFSSMADEFYDRIIELTERLNSLHY